MSFISFRKALESWDFMILTQKLEPALRTYAVQQGAVAVNHFKGSFANQGFTDKALSKWKNRKISQLYLKRSVQTKKKKTVFVLTAQAKRANNAILIKSGALRRSIRSDVHGLTITVSSNLPYAQIHNEGGMAGRGKKSRIPQRQYMGNSEVMMQEFEENFYKMMNGLFK